MTTKTDDFTGIWLHEGERRGQAFSHTQGNYDHAHEGADEASQQPPSTAMKHITVDQEGRSVSVWVPADWSEEDARKSLETDW